MSIQKDKAELLESILGDIASDIEGLDALADKLPSRPAVAIINDLGGLVREALEAIAAIHAEDRSAEGGIE